MNCLFISCDFCGRVVASPDWGVVVVLPVGAAVNRGACADCAEKVVARVGAEACGGKAEGRRQKAEKETRRAA